jgi:glycosyltransferase involved in cell wall biosynthesis
LSFAWKKSLRQTNGWSSPGNYNAPLRRLIEKKQSMKPIAVFIENYNIDYSASIINLLDFLSDCCRVDLFLRNVQMKNSPVLRKKNIRLIEIRRPFHWHKAMVSARQRLANGMKGNLRNAFLPSHASEEISRRFASPEYHCHIVFDPSGMLLCKELFPLAKPFYYSLELALLSEATSGGAVSLPRSLLEQARNWNGDIRGLIIQSREKENLFRQDYDLADTVPCLILPVTCRGNAIAEKSDYLRQALHIPAEKKIALHLGGMNFWFSCMEMAQSFAKLDSWVLVFQGNHCREYLRLFQKKIKAEKIDNIIVLKKFFTEIDSLDLILMSCDVGMAWYNNISPNFSTAGQSSGKIATYLKFGLPVVANRYPSTEEALAKPGCGICVDGMSEIAVALGEIFRNYAFFSANARREYDRIYRFENYHQSIREFLNL